MRPNFFVNTPDILHAYLQYGGPAAFKIRAVLAATGSPELGRLRRLRAVRARRGQARQRGVPRLGEVPDPDPRLGRRRGRGPHAGAVPHPAQRDPPRAPGAAAAAQRHGPQQRRRRTSWSSPSTRCRDGDDDTVIVVVNLDPHATRETMVHLDLPALGLDWHDSLPRPRRDHRRDLELGRAQLRPARPRPRTRPRADRQEAPLTRRELTDADHPSAVRTSATSPDWFKTAVFYEVLVRSFRDSNGDGTGDFKGLTEKLDYLAVARRRLPVGAAVLHLAAARRRLRRRRLHRHPPRGRHRRGLPPLPRRGAQARHPRDHRLRHEPHQRPAPVVPGQPRATPTGPTATSTSGPTPTSSTRTRGSSSSTPSRRTGPGTRCASSTSGTGSSTTSRTSTSTTPRSTRRCSRRWRSGSTWASTASGSTPCPTSTSGRAPTARTSRRPTSSSRRSASSSTTTTPAGCCSCEANQWPADVVDYFGDFEVGGDECHMASTSR